MSTKELNAVLQRVVERSESQKEIRIAKLRAELVDLGYSIVTTEWLNTVINDKARQVAQEAVK